MPDDMAPQRMVPAVIINTLLYRFPRMPTKGTSTACKRSILHYTLSNPQIRCTVQAVFGSHSLCPVLSCISCSMHKMKYSISTQEKGAGSQ